MELKTTVTARSYEVEIGVPAMLRLLNREGINSKHKGPSLSEEIDRIMGVYDTDYDGHFGPSIFYKLEDKYEAQGVHEQVFSLIRAHTK